MDARTVTVNKKIHWQCLFVACGGILLDVFIWLALDEIDFILFAITAFLFPTAVLTVNVFTAVAVPDNGTFPREYCTTVALTFSGIMAVSSFIGRIIIGLASGSIFADAKGVGAVLLFIGVLMLIIFAGSYIVCICAFHLAFRRARKNHTPKDIRS